MNTIQQFKFHDKYLAIDWDILKWAFKISIPFGIANVFFQSPDASKYEHGMWFSVLPESIVEFVYQKKHKQEMGEVLMLTKDGSISLGFTIEDDVATKWVATANEIILKAKPES